MAGGLITADYQMEFGGLLLGDDAFEVVTWDGLNLPDIRTSDTNRPRADGQYAGDDFLSGRTFSVQLELIHDNINDLGDRIIALTDAFMPGVAAQFVVQVPGIGKIYSTARVRRRTGPPFDIQTSLGIANMAVEFYAVDPRWYGLAELTDTATLTDISGGATFPLTFPFTFSETNAGPITANNAGTYETFPTVTIQGPITNPALENVTVGKSLVFTGLTLSASETLVVDFRNRTALLNGTTSRYNFIDDSREWWALQPGNNEVRLNGTSAGSPSALVSWRPAYV